MRARPTFPCLPVSLSSFSFCRIDISSNKKCENPYPSLQVQTNPYSPFYNAIQFLKFSPNPWFGDTTAKGGYKRRIDLSCIYPVENFNSVERILVLPVFPSRETYGPAFGGQH